MAWHAGKGKEETKKVKDTLLLKWGQSDPAPTVPQLDKAGVGLLIVKGPPDSNAQCHLGTAKGGHFPPGLTALNLKFGFYCKECSSFPTAYGNTAHIKASSYTLGPLCELEPQKSIWSGKTVRCGWRTTGFRGEETILPIRVKGNLNTEQKKSTIKNSTLPARWRSQHDRAYGTVTTSRHSFLWQLQRQSDPFFGSRRDIYWAPTTTYSSRCWGVSF